MPRSPTSAAPLAPLPAAVPAAPAPRTMPAAPVPANPTTATATTAETPPQPGMVWVNLESKIYHREGDRWYGRTKRGKFMTEADAIAAGYRASREGAAVKK